MEATEKQHLLDGRRGAGSYTGSLWQDKAGWFPQPQSGLDFQAVELTAQSNHYCHAQKDPSSQYDPKKERARHQLYVASAVCLVFMIGEVIGGYLAHSLAIMTDAAHLLTDFASMLISLFSLWMSSRPATKTLNFGWQRAEILGALLSVLSIWVVTGVLVYLAAERLISGDYEIEGGTMLITSGSAVAVNVIMGLILYQSGHGHSHGNGHSHDGTSQQQENPSVRAAFIHVIGDFLQSLGVLVAAYILYFKPEYKYVDPICTFIFSILVLGTTLTILRDVTLVLMEGTPKGVNFTAVQELLLSVEGVEALHSLHIWALTMAHPVLSVHIAIAQNADAQAVLKVASTRLQGTFHFHTMTIQIENYSEDMKDCQACQGPSD
ncbi:PREDICTED: zinc transporter 2 [Chinchilla lanigera]|uniref:Proton-coupled zinc antiporter SLC30A2 n=1 Tax=Chinchilla lanigera TaxID=34839 RepID=A0A8C2YQ69_CHILA|nr:PREDICTED: zinc transporter 2 [Chinchilla lanigera]